MTKFKPIEMTSKLGFEIEVCSRCGGTGQHSYCQMWGSVCFKCGGSKNVFTKRGSAAYRFYEDLLSVKASDLKVGDSFKMTGITVGGTQSYRYWAKIVAIEPNKLFGQSLKDGVWVDNYGIQFDTEHKKFGKCLYGTYPDKIERKAATAEEKKIALEKALAYQNSLTLTGKPRKVREIA
jgi:hypothetical protein